MGKNFTKWVEKNCGIIHTEQPPFSIILYFHFTFCFKYVYLGNKKAHKKGKTKGHAFL